MPEIDSTIVLIAGTGTVGLGEQSSPVSTLPLLTYRPLSSTAFKKRGVELDLVGVSGGWGYM